MCLKKTSLLNCWRDAFRRRWHELLPSSFGFVLLISMAILARIIIEQNWWGDGFVLLSWISYSGRTGALCAIFVFLFRLGFQFFPGESNLKKGCNFVSLFVFSMYFAFIGFKIGSRYLLSQPSSNVETLIHWGTPTLAISILWLCKGHWYGYVLATCILIVAWLCREPYYNWYCSLNLL